MTHTRLKSSQRFQAVCLMPDGKESHHWTDFEEAAYSVAQSMRESNPDASRILVYDHRPRIAIEF